jgi:hypothetical protein
MNLPFEIETDNVVKDLKSQIYKLEKERDSDNIKIKYLEEKLNKYINYNAIFEYAIIN